MSSRLLAGTRKGLFMFDVHGKSASPVATHFLGEPVTAVLAFDERAWYVAVGARPLRRQAALYRRRRAFPRDGRAPVPESISPMP